ncbi:hypothetical protein GCM10027029_03050 [Conyzicola lurida]
MPREMSREPTARLIAIAAANATTAAIQPTNRRDPGGADVGGTAIGAATVFGDVEVFTQASLS